MFSKDAFGRSPQTFVVSKEISNCPLIFDMSRLGSRCRELGVVDRDRVLLTYDYGKRLLVTAEHTDAKHLRQEDIVEIVDYNPLKDIMMVIGPKDPNTDAPVQWMIQKARHDINITLQVLNPALCDTLPSTVPRTTEPLPTTTIEKAKILLKALHTSPVIGIPSQGIMIIGVNAKAIEQLLATSLKS